MGNKALKSTNFEVLENTIHLDDVQSNFHDVKIPLSRPLNVQLVPQFAVTDTPGRSVRYTLQLIFSNNNQNINDELEVSISSTSSDSDDGGVGPFRVVIQFSETVTREQRKSMVGIARRTSIVKCNSWVGKSSEILIDKKRVRLQGKLKQINIDESESALLNFDLILCPSDLIIPESANEWLLIGTLYVNNHKENKDYKWRAAVPKDLSSA